MDEHEPTIAYLAEHDAQCPACAHSLRGIASPRCPECGYELRLILQPRNANAAAWGWAMASAGAAIGLTANWFAYTAAWWVRYPNTGWEYKLMTIIVGSAFALSVAGFVIVLLRRSWFDAIPIRHARLAAWCAGGASAALMLALWIAYALVL